MTSVVKKIGHSVALSVGSLLNQILRDYINRVLGDGGTVVNSNLTAEHLRNLPATDSIEFAWIGGAGSKKRTSGIYSYFTKLYSFFTSNDAVQTTETSQPFANVNISSNELETLKNPKSSSARYMSHPEINLAANSGWTITTVYNYEGADSPNGTATIDLYGKGGNTSVRVKKNNNVFTFVNTVPAEIASTVSNAFLIGKNAILTVIGTNDGNVKFFVDGVLFDTIASTNGFNANTFMYGREGFSGAYNGKFMGHIIRSTTLTPEQVLQEATYLRSKFPEIPSVQIGDKRLATSNCEAVATPQGNTIANVTDNAAWAGLITPAWSYHSNNYTLGAVFGKIYNGHARDLFVTDIVTQANWGYHVSTEAELAALAAQGGFKLKVAGTDYWTTDNGTNETGFTALGGGTRSDVDGSFNSLKDTTAFWCADSDKVLILNHADNSATITAVDKKFGAYIRMVKD